MRVFNQYSGLVDSGTPIAPYDSRENEKAAAHWGLLLVLFMRGLAILWIFQGLSQWQAVLVPKQVLFDHVTPAWGTAVIFFALLDLVAAIGLWLATPWGGVLWLLAALSQIFVCLSISQFYSFLWVVVNGSLILIYFVLTWLAGRSSGAFTGTKRF